MASTGKKEYTLKINGVAQSIKDVTTLENALIAAEAAAKSFNTTDAKTAPISKAKTAALTDEEKAVKKLKDTQDKIAKANSDANKAQIQANLDLRERTREITRQVAASQLAEGSIKSMGMSLTDLRDNYEGLSAAQRNDEAQGGKLLDQIQALDAQYKALRESTGNFRDSVGNYEKGIAGLEHLSRGIDRVGSGAAGLSANIAGSNAVLDTFGQATEIVGKSAASLYGVLATASLAQEAYNAVVKEGVVQTAATAVVDSVRAVQAKATAAAVALEGEATVGATIAQAAFNLVAAANPYVLIALALVAVGVGLYAFISSTDKAAETQKRANDIMAVTLTELDEYAAKQKIITDAQTAVAEAALDLANAQADGSVKGLKRVQAAEDALFLVRKLNNAKLRGFYASEIADLDVNREKIEQLQEVLRKLKVAQAEGESKIKLDIDLDGKIDKVKVDDAITSVQGAIDNLGKKVEVGLQLKTDQAQIEADAATTAATRKKAAEDLAKAQRATQLQDLRALQDDQAKSVKDTYDERRRLIKQANAREIQDLQIRLATDKTLTADSEKAIQKNITALKKATVKELHDLDIERQTSELQSARDVIDSRTSLIQGADDRETAEINIKYDRQKHDLQNKLKNDTTLTITQRAYMTEQIENIDKLREKDLTAIAAAGLDKRAEQEIASIDETLTEQRDKITKFTGEITVRSKTGLKLIDPDATKANLLATNTALAAYVTNVKKYQVDLETAHKAVLSTLKEGTPEYEAEVLKYSTANESASKKIKDAQREQEDNTRASTKTQIEFYKDLGEKITTYAQEFSNVIGGLMTTVNMGIQASIDSMTAQLDTINTQFDAAQKQQEDAVKNVQDTESQIQDATGGTAIALKSQLADAMAARNEAARNEQKLAKEKDKLDADIAKKQKQMKRDDIISSIAGAIANTAEGVTKALALIFPLNLVVAGIVGAMGLAQVGIMTKQLTKLAKGGKIEGASHASGGVDLAANYEVEGGEYIVNKQSYGRNAALVEYINANPQGVTASDIIGLIPDNATPVAITDFSRSTDDRVVDAINAIEFKPVVAVTDIIKAQDTLVGVQDLAGFN